MTGLERIIGLIRGEQVDRVPWVPYIGIHGAKLIGVSAEAYMKDEKLLLQGLEAARQAYKPDGMVIAFDLQLEAEALGCQLKWYKDSPPSVVTHPLAESDKIPEWHDRLLEDKGHRIESLMKTSKTFCDMVDQSLAVYGLICGPVTLAAHLRGEGFMMDIILNEGYVRELIAFTSKVVEEMARRYMASGVDIIAICDPMVSQISPGHFAKLMYKDFEGLFDYIRSQGRHSALFVCGNVDKQLAIMSQTGPDILSIDEHSDFENAYKTLKDQSVVLSGNLPVATLLLHGHPYDNIAYVKALNISDKSIILSSGCDTPYDTPDENISAVSDYMTDL